MFIDASVLVAILNQESGWQQLVGRIEAAGETPHISPLVRYEAVLAIARAAAEAAATPVSASLVAKAADAVESLCVEIGAVEIPVSGEVGLVAIETVARFGKVVRHKAALNFGDCFAYACARTLGVPLLYKGNDFALTDLA